MPHRRITLFAVQDPRHCLTRKSVDMARYLGWDYWIWAFSALEDFKNSYMETDKLANGHLWVLSVPRQEVRWCALSAVFEQKRPVWKWFHPSPESVRGSGDVPYGLLKAPVLQSWISEKKSAQEVLGRVGLGEGKEAA